MKYSNSKLKLNNNNHVMIIRVDVFYTTLRLEALLAIVVSTYLNSAYISYIAIYIIV